MNVALPAMPDPEDLEEQFRQLIYFEDKMFEQHCFVPPVRRLLILLALALSY